jgi:hypothetical protein
MSAAESPRDEKRFLLLVLLGGVVLRLIWLVRVNGSLTALYGSAEATNVAVALAQGRGFADAYYAGYGPTAHLLPVSPSIAGFLLWLLGFGAVASLVLLAWSLLQSLGAYWLLRALFRRLGADPLVTRWGFVFLCLVPPFVPQETIDFRFWEGALALCLAAANLLLIVRWYDRTDLGWREMLAIAALSAVTFFTCPPAGLATDACWAFFALTRFRFTRSVQLAAISAAALALLVTPWAIRNARVLGEPVLLRSNFGLELAIANHPAALSGRAPQYVFADRLMAIHPFQKGGGARDRLRAAGGEIPYARQLGAETLAWIGAHPAGFAQLSLRHFSEFFVPRPWQMYFTGWEGMRAPRANAIALVNLLGLVGLAVGLKRRRRGYGVLAVYVAVTALPYALLEPTARYIFLVYPLLAFLAVEAVLEVRRYAAGKGLGSAR